MPKLEEIFTTVIIAWHRHAGLAVLKIIARSICFDMVKALRNFWEKLSTSKIKKKRRKEEAEKKRCVFYSENINA